ncbi:MAG TPA: [protein-PII] uridylyltransferase [Terriglobia bacterium]|nr:[protein-PII] uridylyltransferase [Terriglobia bacterium]
MSENATSPPSEQPSLADACAAQFSSLKAGFEAKGDGIHYLRLRSAHVDFVIRALYAALISPQVDAPEGLCLVAAGGYGREELFPFSDLDLYFVARDEPAWKPYREPIAEMARTLWDLQMRVSHSTRTIEECGRLHSGNLEFSVSLLDVRYLAGDLALFERLRSQTILNLIVRDGNDLVRNLIDITSERHAKHGKTIFHLEPDVKEAPGGLRDYHVARWLARIAAMNESRRWIGPEGAVFDGQEPANISGQTSQAQQAFEFLSTVRCFLHFQQGRNDNLLTYELHERAAALGLGVNYGESVDPAQWMRNYYRHVRSIQHLTMREIGDSLPSRSSLYGLFQDWRSRLSNADFSVLRGKIYPRSLAPGGWTILLSLFEMMARHSLGLSREADRWAEQSLNALRAPENKSSGDSTLSAEVWPALRRLLALPGTADALRAMHRLGALAELIPGFRLIDALVIRDFYHRYTVDEHSFMTIQTLCELRRAAKEADGRADENFGAWRRKFAEIYAELEQPELLTLALILHDTGKGMPGKDHAIGSLEVAKSVCARLGIDSADAETVAFLIGRHLEMSATVTRRDIFDTETLRSFAVKMATPERLKMLCLLTCADINAVNPEALTPWKAEMLWQLYAMTANYFSRSVDQDRLQPADETVAISAPALATGSDPTRLKAFLDGFPRRYLAAHSPSEIGEHFEWAQKIVQHPVQAKVRRRGAFNEITVMATDRPFLFASVAGTLAAWGMNILKAEALANRSGLVLDVFRFHDLHRTLEMNPSEIQRLEESVVDVLSGAKNVATMMKGRVNPNSSLGPKVKISAQVSFDDVSSSRCTILEVIAQDRPGLLYRVSATLAELACNIEVALIETEAQKAVDIFYLTRQSAKIEPGFQSVIRDALLERLAKP